MVVYINGDHSGILCYFMVISRDSMGFYGALVGFHGDLDGGFSSWECAMVKLDGFFFKYRLGSCILWES